MSTLTRREFLARAAWLAPALAFGPSLLSACSSSSGPTQSRSGEPNGKLTGKAQILVGFGTGNDPSQVPSQANLARTFEKAHPGTSVSFNRIPDSDTAQQKFTIELTSGRPPDVVLPIGISGITTFLDRNVWLDLAPFMSASGVSLDDFQSPASPAARATSYYGVDSQTVVGVPSGMFTHAIGYNKDLFAKAGVAEPPHEWNTPEWTYDKLVEVATALTRDGKGRTPAQPGFDASDIQQFGLGHWDTGIMTLGYGAHTYDPATHRMQLDTPAYVHGTQAGIDLTYRHHVLATDKLASGVAAGASDPQQGAWQAGKVAMVDLCTCDLPSYGVGNTFRWDVAAWPRGPARTVATLNLDVGAIPKASANHLLGWSVIRDFLTVPGHERTLATQGYGAIPPLKSQSSAFVGYVRDRFPNIDLRVFLDAIPYCTEETEEWYPAFNEISSLDTLQPLYDGTVSAAQILPTYQKQAQALVDKWLANHHLPAA